MNYLLISAILLTAGVAAHAQTTKPDQTGKAKFQQICSACHGADGKGNGPAAQGLAIRPKDLSTTKRSDAELKKIIKDGGPAAGLSPMMPPWGGSLSAQEIENIVQFIRTLGERK